MFGLNWFEFWKDVGVFLIFVVSGFIDFDEKIVLFFDKRWSLLCEMGVVIGVFLVGFLV